MNAPRRQDDHILITGAGSGIGRAIALRLASEGARVTLSGRRASPLQETAALVADQGGSARVLTMDVTDAGAVDAAVDRAVESFGPLHAFVANAGLGGANEPGADDRWLSLVDTNLNGTYWCFRAAQGRMVAEGGHLVVVSSILARIGVPGYTGYCASKAGLLGLTRALACELAEQGTQVNAICPGWVDTDMAWDGLRGMAAGMGITLDEAHIKAMEPVPLGRMSKPEDVAGMVAWLVSADARGVTGQALDMNNGAFMS